MAKYKRKKGKCGLCGEDTCDTKIKVCHDCNSEMKVEYMPSPSQIKLACLLIRKEWSDEEKYIRNVMPDDVSGIREYDSRLVEG